MQLLKRARRRAQKKIEYLEDDKNWKEVKTTSIVPLKLFRFTERAALYFFGRLLPS